MVLPPMRILRSKFAVGNSKDKGGLLAIAKAGLAARHATREKDRSKAEHKGSVKGFQAMSLGSASGKGLGGALRRMGEESKEEAVEKWQYQQLGEFRLMGPNASDPPSAPPRGPLPMLPKDEPQVSATDATSRFIAHQ